MKRMTVILSISLMLAVLCPMSVSAESVKISAEADESVHIGRSFDINLKSNNSDLAAAYIIVSFDFDYLSFKSAKAGTNGEVTVKESDGTVDIICLYSSGLSDEDFLTLTFTAKTGNNSSTQKVFVTCSEAVDVNLNTLSPMNINDIEVDIIKSSSDSADKAYANTSDRTGSRSQSKNSDSKTSSNSQSNSTDEDLSINSRTVRSFQEQGSISQNHNRSTLAGEGFITGGSDYGSYIIGGVGTLAVVVILAAIYTLGKNNAKRSSAVNDDDTHLNI